MSRISIRFLLVIFGLTVLVLTATGSEASAKEGLLAEYNRITKPANYDPRHNSEELFWMAGNVYVRKGQSVSPKIHYWDVPESDRNSFDEWFKSNEECISFVRKAAAKKYYWKEYRARGNQMFDLEFTDLSKLADLIVLMTLYAERAADQGRTDEAFGLLLGLYKLGAQFQGPRLFGEQLAGIHVCIKSFASALQIIEHVHVDHATLAIYQQRLMGLLKSRPIDISYSEGEKLLTLEVIHRTFTDDGRGNGKLIPKLLVEVIELVSFPKKLGLQEARKIAYKHPDKQETIAILDNSLDRMKAIGKEGLWALHQRGTDYEKETDRFVEKAYLLKQMMTGGAYGVSDRYKSYTSAIVAILAISRYRHEKGHLPEKLDILVEDGYLQELPCDPYSDGPLVYRRMEDDFILYSVWGDFKDDGGKHVAWWPRKTDDFVFWPAQKAALN